MPNLYELTNTHEIFTPALVFYPEIIQQNIKAVIQMAGGPERLRPHVKTHKTAEITKLQLDAGVTKHKCATIAEAELLARTGVPDVLISYPLVGPNVGRLVRLIAEYPGTQFSTIVDHPAQIEPLSAALSAACQVIDILVDVNVGMNRTGIAPGRDCLKLYEQLSTTPGIRPGGFQLYDGHNHTPPQAEREVICTAAISQVLPMREILEKQGLNVPRLVCGGTPSFPIYAKMTDIPGLECSPGTYVLHDVGYGSRYADLQTVTPAAIFLTRIISRPTPTRVTLDLGNKAIAADPILTKRVKLLDFPDYEIVMHSEEHLVVETTTPTDLAPGTLVYAIPGHVCPSVALHETVHTAQNNRITGHWPITARIRKLTI